MTKITARIEKMFPNINAVVVRFWEDAKLTPPVITINEDVLPILRDAIDSYLSQKEA